VKEAETRLLAGKRWKMAMPSSMSET
jgi:hypothetical protein